MLDKIFTLLLVGSFAGLVGYNLASIFNSSKSLLKSVMLSSLAAVFVGIVNINLMNLGSNLLSLTVNDAKSPLIYAALGSLLVSVVPLENRKLKITSNGRIGNRSEKSNLLGRVFWRVREVYFNFL